MPDFVMPSKFPFWSAIIIQNQSSVSAPAGAWTYINIQPPTGEVWLLFITGAGDYISGGQYERIEYYDFDGTTRRLHDRDYGYPNATYPEPRTVHLEMVKILTNTLYGSIGLYPTFAGSLNVGYSGFKLSKPLWNAIRNNDPLLPWKKPTTLSLPPILSGLQPYAYEFLGIDPDKPNDYVLGILLEENTPLAYDPNTNFAVERLTVVVSADALAKIIANYKAGKVDLIQLGYGKYIDLFKKAGVI